MVSVMVGATVGPQPTSPHQELCDCVVALVDSGSGPDGCVVSKAQYGSDLSSISGPNGILPVDSTLGSSPSVLASSPDNCEELASASSALGTFTDATARSRGTLGRPRKGILSEKRLVEGFKADKF